VLCHFFPAKGTLLEATIYEDSDVISAGASFSKEEGSDGGDEKKVAVVRDSEVV
jgi:nucleobase:cation symporter-1, NCS1 family